MEELVQFLDVAPFIDKLRSLLSGPGSPGYPAGVGASIRAALLRESGRTELVEARVLFGQQQSASIDCDYGRVVLKDWWLDQQEAIASLHSAWTQNILGGVQFAGRLGKVLGRRSVDQAPLGSGWPEHHFYSKVQDPALGIPAGPVVGIGCPPFPTGGEAIIRWVWGVPLRGEEVQRFVNIFVPDTRGRIAQATWSSDALTIDTDQSVTPLELQVVFTHETDRITNSTRVSTPHTTVIAPRGASGAELYLLAPNGDLLSLVRLAGTGDEFAGGRNRRHRREQERISCRVSPIA